MARLAVFYNHLDPRTQDAVNLYAPAVSLEPEWVDTSPSLDTYADELEKRWTGEEDLILIEQDKEIFPGTLPELLNCGGDWCTCTCWVHPVPHTSLAVGAFGCTKFSAEIQRRVPVDVFRGDFQQGIDRRFHDHLLSMGIGVCLHSMVLHHHVYKPRPQALLDHVANLRVQGILPPAMYPEPADPGLLPGSYRLSQLT